MLAPGQSPFPKKTECKQCLTKPCHHLFVGRVYPGKITFVHHSEFAALTTHRPDFRMKKDDDAGAAALTDNIEVAPKEKVTVTNPRWEHVDEERKKNNPKEAAFGDPIFLMADIQNYPEGAPVTFDIFDTTENLPLRRDSVKGTNSQGVGKGEWKVIDKSGKGEAQKLSFEAIAKSMATDKCPIPLTFEGLFFQIDLDNPHTEDDKIIVTDIDGNEVETVCMKNEKEVVEDYVRLVFKKLEDGKKYNVIYDPGKEGFPFPVLCDVDAAFLKGKKSENP
jgi:hypothetical protein